MERGKTVDGCQVGKRKKYRFSLSREVAALLPLNALIAHKTEPLGMKGRQVLAHDVLLQLDMELCHLCFSMFKR